MQCGDTVWHNIKPWTCLLLIKFLSTWHKLGSSENLNWKKNTFIRLPYKQFCSAYSSLVIDIWGSSQLRQCQPWALGPGLCKQASRVSHREQAICSPHFWSLLFVFSLQVPAWVPVLSSLHNGCWNISWNKPLPPQVPFCPSNGKASRNTKWPVILG